MKRWFFPAMLLLLLFDHTRIGFGVSLFHLGFFSAAVIVGFVFALRGGIRLPFRSMHLLLYGFGIVGVISAIFSADPILAAKRIAIVGAYAVPSYFLFLFLVHYRHDIVLDDIGRILGLVAVLGAVTVFLDFLGLRLFVGWIEQGGSSRSVGILGEPNHTAAVLGTFWPLTLWAVERFSHRRESIKGVAAIGAVILTAGAILLTGSRMGVVMLLFGSTFWLIRSRVTIFRPAILVGILALGLLAFQVSQSEVLTPVAAMLDERVGNMWGVLLGVQDPIGQSVDIRIALVNIGVAVFMEHPVIGAGLDTSSKLFASLPLQPNAFHNTFIDVLAGMGIIGFSLFIGIMALCATSFWRAYSLTKDALYWYMLITFGNLLISMFFLSQLSSHVFWTLHLPLAAYLDWCLRRRSDGSHELALAPRTSGVTS